MKVLHVIWHLGQGGAQTYLYNLIAQQLSDPEVQPHLLVLAGQDLLSEKFEALLPVSYLQMTGGTDLLRAMKIPRMLAAVDPDLVHSHSNNLLFNSFLQVCRKPVVYTEHGGALLGGRVNARLIYRYLYRPIRRFIAISEAMAALMSDINPRLGERVALAYNGIDFDGVRELPAAAEGALPADTDWASFRVGIVGRLEPQKGIDLFIETAAEVCKTRSDTVFFIVGEGSLRRSLEDLVAARGLRDKVIFMGYRQDALALLKLFDLFLFTSSYEPFGLVITEAMAAEVPVVAMHERGAVPEILTDGSDGRIVNGKSPALLADAVNATLNGPDTARSLVRAAVETVRRRFTMDVNAARVREIYRECLAAG